MLQQLHETTIAQQHDTTVQDNIALLPQKTRFKDSEKEMKKQFERQEESIYGKFKDMNTVVEKNQESIMNAIETKNSVVQTQIDQLGQVDSLQKHCEDKVEQTEGAKRARCRSN
eukprot:12162288-Ditylum_brightwellii.AAC.1